MMPLQRAIRVAEQQYPDLTATGQGYRYEGNYYLELAPKDYNPETDGLISDAYYEIDGTTAKVRPYSPIVDGFHEPSKIEFLD